MMTRAEGGAFSSPTPLLRLGMHWGKTRLEKTQQREVEPDQGEGQREEQARLQPAATQLTADVQQAHDAARSLDSAVPVSQRAQPQIASSEPARKWK